MDVCRIRLYVFLFLLTATYLGSDISRSLFYCCSNSVEVYLCIACFSQDLVVCFMFDELVLDD